MIPREAASAPETHNSEQDEESQAPDIEALRREGGDIEIGESEHGGRSDPGEIIPDDVPDLVDRMEGMVRTGRIDYDAFAGEPIHDDEEELYGDTGSEDEDE
jgi:hypothetical protein